MKTLILVCIGLFLSALPLQMVLAQAGEALYDISLKDIDGKPTSLKPFKGKVLLIVNVASKCGYTPQYAGLESLYRKYMDKGLVILGFPCNQFGSQEPGSREQIKQFCSSTYQVTFPMFDKIEVNGEGRNALYTALAGKESPFSGNIRWNFTKFLVGRDGKLLGRFESKVKPESEEMTRAIEAALAAP